MPTFIVFKDKFFFRIQL